MEREEGLGGENNVGESTGFRKTRLGKEWLAEGDGG